MINKKIYALYHGDNFIDLGNREYLAKLLNVTKKTISFYGSPTYQKRNNYKGYIVIRVEDDDKRNNSQNNRLS